LLPESLAGRLADGRKADRSALFAAEARAGDPTGAQPGRGAVEHAAVAAIGARHLDGEAVAGEVAEGEQRSAYGQAPSRGVNRRSMM
jgi:hypothetical protein